MQDLPARLLVAVSGGCDSMALLRLLHEIGGRELRVVHFDHRWRAESGAEARWVGAEARRLGRAVTIGRAPADLKKCEAAARQARYTFFARVARRQKTVDLVLAHHADDLVETFLLQLFRGAGSGARGLLGRSERDGLVLHRPWLSVRRAEIVALAQSRAWTWREDASNRDLRLRRNRLRHDLLPRLREVFGSSVDENLARAAHLAQVEGEWLESLCRPRAQTAELAIKQLRELPLALRRRTIRAWLQYHSTPDLGFAEIEAVAGLLERGQPAKINLPGGRHVRRRAGIIFIENGR